MPTREIQHEFDDANMYMPAVNTFDPCFFPILGGEIRDASNAPEMVWQQQTPERVDRLCTNRKRGECFLRVFDPSSEK